MVAVVRAPEIETSELFDELVVIQTFEQSLSPFVPVPGFGECHPGCPNRSAGIEPAVVFTYPPDVSRHEVIESWPQPTGRHLQTVWRLAGLSRDQIPRIVRIDAEQFWRAGTDVIDLIVTSVVNISLAPMKKCRNLAFLGYIFPPNSWILAYLRLEPTLPITPPPIVNTSVSIELANLPVFLLNTCPLNLFFTT